MACFDKAIEKNPNFSPAIKLKADTFAKMQNMEEAVYWYKKNIPFNPNDLHVIVQLGINVTNLTF